MVVTNTIAANAMVDQLASVDHKRIRRASQITGSTVVTVTTTLVAMKTTGGIDDEQPLQDELLDADVAHSPQFG